MIFHDACYGHRFSRPRTTKASLSTIVERPERILATALGASTAYVLLGSRHAGGLHPPHPKARPGPPPFLLRNSSRRTPITSQPVTSVHGIKWMAELKEMCEGAEFKLTKNGKELVRPKTIAGESDEDKPRLHEGDLYLCAESLEAFEGALGGVLDAVDTVFNPLAPSRCFACVRPPGHHCSSDYPSGFCWLNNVHVGISYAAATHGLTHAAIFDFDLHHGDGSQSITWNHNADVQTLPKNAVLSRKTAIGYFSLHDINSYPCEWGDEEKVRNASLCIENAHGQSVWNVHLQPWKTEEEFWKLYDDRYAVLLTKMRAFLRTQYEKFRIASLTSKPKSAIFISAGFDASEWEGQGMQRHKVSVPTDFYARVTQDIVAIAEEEGLGVDGRVISVLEGGYSDRALTSGVISHICGLASGSPHNGFDAKQTQIPIPHQRNWWKLPHLEELERITSPPQAVPPPKKPRSGPAPTYQTPTQSFSAKVVSPPTYHRSISGSMSRRSSTSTVSSRAPSPPPPDVEWAIASYELSRIIIPQDRQTRSCRPEDLNAKATEARRNRQSAIGVAGPDEITESLEKMQLRDRKAKSTKKSESEESRPTSRASVNRRRTIGGVEQSEKDLTKVHNRRVSVASTILSNSDDGTEKQDDSSLEPLLPQKTRAPAKPRVKKSAPKPPLPRIPSSFERDGATALPRASGGVPGMVSPTSEQAIDDLTSKIKKIKLKVNPPKEVQDHSESGKGLNAEAKKSVPKVPRKTAMKKTTPKETAKADHKIPIMAATAATTGTVSKSIPSSIADFQPLVPSVVSFSDNAEVKPKQEPLNTTSQTLFTPTTSHSATPANTHVADSLPSFQPPDQSSLPAPTATLMPESQTYSVADVSMPPMPAMEQAAGAPLALPPTTVPSASTTVTSSPRSSKYNLPVFSSSSSIPFGPSTKIIPEQNPLKEKSTNGPVEHPKVDDEEEQQTKVRPTFG